MKSHIYKPKPQKSHFQTINIIKNPFDIDSWEK